MTDISDRSRVKSVGTTFDIVQYLHQTGTASLKDIASAVGIGTSTAHRHLVTMYEHGYVVRSENKYGLSLLFLTYGGRQREDIPANELINRKVRQLSEETSERVQFITEEHDERVYMFTSAGSNAVRTDATIGKRGPLHVSAAGKAILANLPADERNRILNEAEDPKTKSGTPEREALEAELRTVRERDCAFNDEESTSGLRAVGVPVRESNEVMLGAISLSGPANRLTGDYFRKEIPNLLLGTVNEIELNIQYQ